MLKKNPFFRVCYEYLRANKPLALSQLFHKKTRLIVAMTGVAFSKILIFSQLGIRALLFEGITLIPENLQGDLFLVSSYNPSINFGSFPRIFLYQAQAFSEVFSASPLYIGSAKWLNPEELLSSENQKHNSSRKRSLFSNQVKILAFNPAQPVLALPEVNRQLEQLNIPGSLLFDVLSQSQLGPVPELLQQQSIVTTLMERKRVTVVGLFSLGSTFFDKGHIVMSDWNYARWQGGVKSLDKVSVGVLQLKPSADIKLVQQQLQKSLSRDVRVLTQKELSQQEQNFRAQFPEGKILNFGAAVGFIVGIVIVYQVLYADVSEHLAEYATLKAIGYSNTSLLALVLQEAIILGVLGFIPGYLASYGVYGLLFQITRIPLVMKADIALQVFLLTLIMCSISGALAMNKLRSADPADVF